MAIAVGGCLLTYIKPVEKILLYVKIPVTTYLCIVALCLFNAALLRTRLGQNMRTVGQSQTVANAAGINVDTTRIIAMIISTTLACWGQLIYLQNIGTFSTYGAHTQVGQYAIAALLVGGASVKKASSKQAVIGVILFHTLFIVAPQAGKQLFNNAQLGEYFRVFVAYGVIAVSLAMHAWKDRGKTKEPNRNRV
jgi:simple sugar transport system permease protein